MSNICGLRLIGKRLAARSDDRRIRPQFWLAEPDTRLICVAALTVSAANTRQVETAMLFSVIYSVDCPDDENISDFVPPDLDLWDETEGDDQYEYEHLEGRWAKGSHQKFCGILDREQFDKFIDHCGLVAETTETLGSIGAPGFGYGWAPAISFISTNPDAIQSAYVTPMPEVSRLDGDENDWQRVRRGVLAVYG